MGISLRGPLLSLPACLDPTHMCLSWNSLHRRRSPGASTLSLSRTSFPARACPRGGARPGGGRAGLRGDFPWKVADVTNSRAHVRRAQSKLRPGGRTEKQGPGRRLAAAEGSPFGGVQGPQDDLLDKSRFLPAAPHH